jgi:hypothetical protein
MTILHLDPILQFQVNTLRTGDADLRLYAYKKFIYPVPIVLSYMHNKCNYSDSSQKIIYRSSIFSPHSTFICFRIIPMASILICIVWQYHTACIHKLAMFPHRHWCNPFMITPISPFTETGEVYEWILRHWWHLSSELKHTGNRLITNGTKFTWQ